MNAAATLRRPPPRGALVQAGLVALLLALAGASWALTDERMGGMDAGPGSELGGLGWFAVTWLAMMAAMMLPACSPNGGALARGQGRGRSGWGSSTASSAWAAAGR